MKLTLIERRTEAPSVESFIFKPEESLTWQAGQFLHYTLHHEPTDDRGSERWFTIASAPFEKTVMLTTRIASEKSSSFKSALLALKISETIETPEAPEGDFVLADLTAEYVFIAGGIGVTPFHSILKEADHRGTQPKITMLYANRDHNIPYQEEFARFAKNNPNLTIHYVVSPERVDEDLIKKLVPDSSKPIFYVSGPEPMVESLGNTLKEIGVPTEHLKQDFFPGYPSL